MAKMAFERAAVAGVCAVLCLISFAVAASAAKAPKTETYITCYSGSSCGVYLYLYPGTKAFAQEPSRYGDEYIGTYEMPRGKIEMLGTGTMNKGCIFNAPKKGDAYTGEVVCPGGRQWSSTLTKVKD